MKLEQQVTSLEIYKKLKDLGVKQESLYYYAHYGKLTTYEDLYKGYVEDFNDKDTPFRGKFHHWLKEVNSGECYSAFTVAELGEMLPCYNFEYPYSFKMSSGKEFSACWIDAKTQRIIHQVVADTEADARGKMLIYLLENKLIAL